VQLLLKMTTTTTVSIQIKWGKETLSLDNYTPASGVKGLKTELEVLTGVPADRMKVMSKSKGLWKGLLKDDTDLLALDWKGASSKGPVQILLMGSAADLVGPKEKVVFLEDLPPEEVAKVAEPAGLVNLGNTCYLNSVVQCLRAIPQFRNSLLQYSPTRPNEIPSATTASVGGSALFLASLREAYRSLDRQASAYQPVALVQTTKMAFPQFAQRGPQGQPMQQDAEEFYSGLLTIAAAETQHNRQQYFQAAFASGNNGTASSGGGGSGVSEEEQLMGATNVIDAIFGLKMKETLTCDEVVATTTNVDELIEPPVVSFDLHRKLVCNIQGGSDGNSVANVNHIVEGIQLSLDGVIEKHSDVLNRNAMWTRKQRIARLPPILTVQFGRFYWKATPDSQDHAGVKCKVMKPVAFSSQLDLYEFCTPEIQSVLKLARDKALKAEEDRINAKLKGQLDAAAVTPGGDNDDIKMEDATTSNEQKVESNESVADEEMDDEELKAALALSVQPDPIPIGPGLPTDFQGIYELFAVVTHKGRDADGGHYMAWVKADHPSSSAASEKIADSDEENADWFVFDDDEVSPCKTEDVLKLKGGGDWHMSYLNFYRAKK
jgi:ubiquitin carboxyl-terminal hydrolase 14